MFNNPELKKNFRLEVNMTRLASCFGLLLLLFFTIYNGDTSGLNEKQLYKYTEKIFAVFAGVGFFFVIGWGTYLTANSFQEEVRQKTWDFVRMSSLSPAKILIGKLFGSTSLVWIVGLIGIMPILMLTASSLIPEPPYIRSAGLTLSVFFGSLICWALLSHSISIICSMHSLVHLREREKFNTIGITFLVMIAGFSIGAFLISQFDVFHDPRSLKRLESGSSKYLSSWFGQQYYGLDTAFMILAFSAFWAVIGAYRMLRESLLFRDPPWAWIAFLITTCVFLHGFTSDAEFRKFLFWPVVLCTLTMLITAIFESRDVVKYKTLAAHFKNGRITEAFRYMPLWVISFTFLVITLITGIIVVNNETTTILSVGSLIAFVIRDMLVLHYLSWKPNIRRPLLGCVLYAIVAYMLLPAIMKPIAGQISAMFFPLMPIKALQHMGADGWIFNYWVFQAASIGLAAYLFSRRWNRTFKQEASATQPTLPVQP